MYSLCSQSHDGSHHEWRFSRGLFLFFFADTAIYPFQIVVLVEGEIEGRVSIASRAFVYTNAILLCKMLVGLCPNPICSASCRCRLRVCSKHFHNKKDSLGLFHEGRILGYLHLSGLHFFGTALFLCKKHFYVSLCTKKLLHFFFRFSIVRVACFLFCQQVGIFRV